MADYDLITIGGGLGGAALARSMAERGARALVLERETKFRDRVRGEGMTPWGVAEARELGIYDVLASNCGHELPIWDNYVGPMQVLHRDLPATTPQATPTLSFYHPDMQHAVLDAAAAAGAEVRTGVRVTGVTPGAMPSLTVQNGSAPERLTARIIVAADGRGSMARKWGGFTERRDADRLFMAGLLLDGCTAPDDTTRFVSDFAQGHGAIIFPQGGGRVRAYLVTRVEEGVRLQGEKDVERFVQELVRAGMPGEFFERVTAAGPLATFEGADCWVEHPYAGGIALIGDAAASSDPSWGQGMSLTLRDVRILRDALSADGDRDAAGHAYAAEHDRYFGVVHTMEDWFTQLFYTTGPEADAVRGRALALAAEDPTRQPDTLLSGPDHLLDETARRRFFGEE